MTELLNLVRDIMVIGYLFILRIGVPILITLMLGAWVRKLLEQPEGEPATKPVPETKEIR